MRERITRGKTRPGRLALLDRWVVARADVRGLVVDVGIGANPDTTVELFRAVRPHGGEVLGVDLDPDRVHAAQRAREPGLSFAHGGFDLPIDRPAVLIRAMNVLRQYRPEQVADAHRSLGESLVEGGILLEGSTNKTGDVLACHLLRRRGELRREGLVFGVRGVGGFAPRQLQDVLPRDLRGTDVGGFFDRWTDAWELVREGLAPIDAFAASARELADRGEPVDFVADGVLAWLATPGPARDDPQEP